eukprot:9931123-Lingulodinium_polyedra.AAC.1
MPVPRLSPAPLPPPVSAARQRPRHGRRGSRGFRGGAAGDLPRRVSAAFSGRAVARQGRRAPGSPRRRPRR